MRRLAPLLSCAALAACGSSGNIDGGPPVTAQAYYALVPGRCYEYSSIDGGQPTLGLEITSEAAGVAMALLRHGQETRVDHLVFDGGVALLAQQDFISGALRTRSYTPPIELLEAPPATGAPALSSSVSYTDSPGGKGTETWQTLLLQEQAFSCAAGSYPTAFELQFSAGDSLVDGGESFVLERRWAAPDAGFVDIYTTNDVGVYVDFSLVDVRSADGGCAAH